MPKKIFKYKMPIEDEVIILMPKGAEYLTVDSQYEIPCLWALVSPENEEIEHKFCIRGTGHPFNGNEGKFLGTFQLRNGDLVFHVFSRK